MSTPGVSHQDTPASARGQVASGPAWPHGRETIAALDVDPSRGLTP
jgi:hypothetical protein